jgi:hypothetical protein
VDPDVVDRREDGNLVDVAGFVDGLLFGFA